MTGDPLVTNSPLKDLELMSKVAWANIPTGGNFEKNLQGVAAVVHNKVAQEGSLAGIMNPVNFPGNASEDFDRALKNEFTSKEEYQYKRVIQTLSGMSRGFIRDATNGANHFEPITKDNKQGVFSSGSHVFIKKPL